VQVESATSATNTDILLGSALRRSVVTGVTELDTSHVTVPMKSQETEEVLHHVRLVMKL